MATPKLVISLDFELGWGSIENGRWKKRQKDGVYRRMRDDIPYFLETLDRLDIPLTWAFVGAMLEEPSERSFEHLPEPIRSATEGFSSGAESATTDARDLFDMILDCRVKHALGCHSYSHVRFDYEGVDKHYIKREMELFRRVCRKYEINVDTLVFPQNIEGFHSELRDSGIRTMRTAAKINMKNGKLSKIVNALTKPPPLSEAETVDGGVTLKSGSMFYNSGPGRILRLPVIFRQATSGINHAIRENGTFHIWIHPFNFSESPFLLNSFIRILEYASKKRDKGLIEIQPFV